MLLHLIVVLICIFLMTSTTEPFFICFFVLVGSHGKASVYNAGDLGSIPGSGRSPGEGNSNPLQDSCLENPMDRGVWRVTVHGVARVGHNLASKPPPPPYQQQSIN